MPKRARLCKKQRKIPPLKVIHNLADAWIMNGKTSEVRNLGQKLKDYKWGVDEAKQVVQYISKLTRSNDMDSMTQQAFAVGKLMAMEHVKRRHVISDLVHPKEPQGTFADILADIPLFDKVYIRPQADIQRSVVAEWLPRASGETVKICPFLMSAFESAKDKIEEAPPGGWPKGDFFYE